VELDAFIVSYTPYNRIEQQYRSYRIRRDELEKDKHVIFQYERDGMLNPSYVDRMFDLTHL